MRKAILFLLFWTAPVQADPVTFEFQGVTTFSSGNSFETPFSGTFTFNPTAKDLFPDDQLIDSYVSSGQPYGITVDILGHHLEFNSIEIDVYPQWVNTASKSKTQFHVTTLPADGTWVNLNIIHDNLIDGPVDTDQNSLPLSPINLTTYPINKFFLWDPEVGSFTAENFTSVKPVPEPAIGLLLFVGLAALLWLRKVHAGYRRPNFANVTDRQPRISVP